MIDRQTLFAARLTPALVSKLQQAADALGFGVLRLELDGRHAFDTSLDPASAA